VKLGQHRSSETTLEVGEPQGSVLGPLLFAVYCSPVADIIASHGVRCHQYADDTQLHLAMRVDNTAAGLSILPACTTALKTSADIRKRIFNSCAYYLRSSCLKVHYYINCIFHFRVLDTEHLILNISIEAKLSGKKIYEYSSTAFKAFV